jgi:hypothetical protein
MLVCSTQDYLDFIVDMREYDVPYIVRAMIDQGFRVALWYSIKSTQGTVVVEQRKDLIAFPEPRVFAFDIETTKLPLKVRLSSAHAAMLPTCVNCTHPMSFFFYLCSNISPVSRFANRLDHDDFLHD